MTAPAPSPAAPPRTAPAMLARRASGEFLGTGLLVTVVVGSGIAAQRLSGDVGLRLLENSLATAFGLGVLILLFGPVSGAHFNPVVSIADSILGRRGRTGLPLAVAGIYVAAQMAGAIGGAILANAMFDSPTSLSATPRATPATLLGEIVATTGLVLLIIGLARTRRSVPVVAGAVGAYIGAAYWFTSSTSFANPAVTVGRMFTDTFAGIAPSSVLPFVIAQLVGTAIGLGAAALLFPRASASRDLVAEPVLTERKDVTG